MNLSNLKSIKKIFKKQEERRNDLFVKQKQKCFEKKPKPHIKDVTEKKEREEKNETFDEDEQLQSEEKQHIEISDIVGIPVDKTELKKTRKLHEDMPSELKSYKKGGGYFTCDYCYQKHRGWYYHRNECPEYLEDGKCEYCQIPLETVWEVKQHSKKCKVKNASTSLSS